MTNTIQKQIIVVDMDNFTAKRYAPAQFIEAFAEEAPTRNGVEKIWQYNEDEKHIFDARTRKIVAENIEKDFAEKMLLDWALEDIRGYCDTYEAFTSDDQVIDFLDQMIENYKCDENDEAVEKCKQMKEAL